MNDATTLLMKLALLANVPASELSDATSIRPAEWDSIDLLDVIASIDEAYDVTIDSKRLYACRTVGELRALIGAADIEPRT